MEERKACLLLKARFERAGFHIEENRAFDEGGVQFEIDGFDPERRVGYEYITEEAGDGWDVDGAVVAALDARRKAGELHVLVVDERDAPDDASLNEAIDAFLDGLPKPKAKPAKKPGAKAKPKKPAAKKKTKA
ncbi:MAG TPA: hypothetical protein VGO00_16220 [Kofleriaceae bacterium]|jgi:hypothetical protein|nr:hypothetical protein [Kofleriaceae bacterium]